MSITPPPPTHPHPSAEASLCCDGKQGRKQETIPSFKTGESRAMCNTMRASASSDELQAENSCIKKEPEAYLGMLLGGGESNGRVQMEHPTSRVSCEAAGGG